MMATVLRMALWLAARLPVRLQVRLARLVAGANLGLNTDAARVTRTNLTTCFPHLSADELEALCRSSLMHMSLLFFEFAQLAHWAPERLLGQITQVQGKAALDDAYAEGNGVLLLVPHFGNWELLCAYLGTHYQFAALYDPPKVASTEAVIVEARQRFQGELFPIDTGGMRKLVRAMRDGKLIAVLPDQVPERSAGVHAPFFNQPALTMTLIHRLVKNSPTAVVLGTVQRVVEPQGIRYTLAFEALDESFGQTDAEYTAATMNAAIERVIERAPEQYQWEYKRFKRPPQRGKHNIYRD